MMYRKIIKAACEDDLNIQLPSEYLNKEVEVIAFEIADVEYDKKRQEVDEAIEFFKGLSVDMSDFKFDRDEANQR